MTPDLLSAIFQIWYPLGFGALWMAFNYYVRYASRVTQTKLPHESIRDFRTTMVTCDPYGRHTACTPPAESDKYIQSRYLAMRN